MEPTGAYVCKVCGYAYFEQHGDPSAGIEPDTAWDDLPVDWHCPDCGASKDAFEGIDV